MLHVDKLQSRAQKFLQMAGHPSACENEALTAVRALRRLADVGNVTISDLRFAPEKWPKAADPFMRERIKSLESDIKLAVEKMDLQAQVIEFQAAQIASLQAALAAREATAAASTSQAASADPAVEALADSDYVPLGPIVEQIVRKTGRKHITTAAAHALGIPVVEMRAWTVVKTMPATLAHKLASLPAEALAAASRKRWSDAEVASLKMLVAQGLDNLAIALALSKQFGRRIFEGAVSRARSKLVMAELGQRCRSGTSYGAAHL